MDFVLAMDAIFVYGIDTITSKSVGSMSIKGQDLAFHLEFKPHTTGERSRTCRESLPVICAESITIPAIHETNG